MNWKQCLSFEFEIMYKKERKKEMFPLNVKNVGRVIQEGTLEHSKPRMHLLFPKSK